jgi:hypothetical protein
MWGAIGTARSIILRTAEPRFVIDWGPGSGAGLAWDANGSKISAGMSFSHLDLDNSGMQIPSTSSGNLFPNAPPQLVSSQRRSSRAALGRIDL